MCSDDHLPGGGPKTVFGPLSSLKIIWTRKIKKIYETHERPPYPIIISNPQFKDVINNLKLPDYIFFLTFYFGGTIPAYISSARLPSLKARLYTYHLMAASFTLIGLLGMYGCS